MTSSSTARPHQMPALALECKATVSADRLICTATDAVDDPTTAGLRRGCVANPGDAVCQPRTAVGRVERRDVDEPRGR